MDLAALRRWWPLAAVVGLLLLASLAATRSTPQLDRISPPAQPTPAATATVQLEPDPEAELSAEPAFAEPEVSEGLPDWAGWAALLLLAAVLAGIIVVLVVAIVRDQVRRRTARARARPVREQPPSTTDDLVAALDAGLLELADTDLDPRRSVIACWLRLEQAAADAGTARRPGDTPGELVGRLLAEQHVTASVLADLAAVYREARYATHTVDEMMRADARAALQRLRADLAAVTPGEAVGAGPVGPDPAAAPGPAGVLR
ncbi:MAG TPA: DUF4129 domain-containing protein [Actinoplanes sp.]|nr:DUF4129 domain-containing protein [Actinoplanes sp.]